MYIRIKDVIVTFMLQSQDVLYMGLQYDVVACHARENLKLNLQNVVAHSGNNQSESI